MLKKEIVKIVSFILVCTTLFLGWQHIYCFKETDGIEGMKVFYSEPQNSIDVMVFGSSHAFVNINAPVLWQDYGIASYNLGGSIQPIWNTYYYIKEALKYQKPKVIVVDVYTATQEQDYIDDSRIIKNLYGMRPSLDKISALKVSSPKKLWPQYLLEYPTYHTRYSELDSYDFSEYGNLSNADEWKGFVPCFYTAAQSFMDISGITAKRALTDKNQEYLDKIIDLVNGVDIPMVFVASPYALTETEAERFNTVADIAKQNDIPFIYCNRNEILSRIDVNPETDYQDSAHMNQQGTVKYTRFIADYLKANYEIPDRRGDSSYFDYDKMLHDYVNQVEDNHIISCGDGTTYLQQVFNNKDYIVVITVDGNVAEPLLSTFKSISGIDKNQAIDYSQHPIWVLENGTVVKSSTTDEDYSFDVVRKSCSLMVSRTYPTATKNSDAVISEENARLESERNGKEYSEPQQVRFNNIIINGASSKKVSDGINIAVYDTFTGRFVDCAGINNDLTITR